MGVYFWTEYVPPMPDYLCFTAEEAGCEIKLTKVGSPTAVTLETSRDGNSRYTYTPGQDIEVLSFVGQKVYFRNTSETDTGFSTSISDYYQFVMIGSISSSGDINYLLNKNSTDTVPDNAFRMLFASCVELISCPRLPATTLGQFCYNNMFNSCTGLRTLPKLPATTLKNYCYGGMFYGCSNIKISATQTGEYQTEYRIPTTGTGIDATNATGNMVNATGGTLTGTLAINTTYYTSNTVV